MVQLHSKTHNVLQQMCLVAQACSRSITTKGQGKNVISSDVSKTSAMHHNQVKARRPAIRRSKQGRRALNTSGLLSARSAQPAQLRPEMGWSVRTLSQRREKARM